MSYTRLEITYLSKKYLFAIIATVDRVIICINLQFKGVIDVSNVVGQRIGGTRFDEIEF